VRTCPKRYFFNERKPILAPHKTESGWLDAPRYGCMKASPK